MKFLNSLLIIVLISASSIAFAKKVNPPADGAYHGAFASFGAQEDEVTSERIVEFENKAGKQIAWAYFSNHWLNAVIQFPTANVEACKKSRTIPYIRLQPWSQMRQNSPDPVFSLQSIIDGKFDPPLREWARDARDSGTRIMVEFGPEVNGSWFPWNGKWNGAGQKTGYGDPNWPDGPERFRDAYRHIINLFREEGANNITWVLHVDTQWDPTVSWNRLRYYYPGDEYIDWIGLSVFGPQLLTHDWESFTNLLKGFWPQIDETSSTKPILISEYGAIESPRDASRKAEWIKDALQSISNERFPRIKGMTYWNSDGWRNDPRLSFKIDTSIGSLNVYRTEVSRPFWIGRIQN